MPLKRQQESHGGWTLLFQGLAAVCGQKLAKITSDETSIIYWLPYETTDRRIPSQLIIIEDTTIVLVV